MTTATLHSPIHQEGTRYRARVRFDGPEGVVLTGWLWWDASPTQADVDALIPGYEARATEREQEQAIAAVQSGADLETVPLVWTTRAAFRRRMMARLLNRMRSADTDTDKYRIIANVAPYIARYTDAQVASAIGWTEQQVATARAKLVAYKQVIDNLDHGLPEVSE